MLFEYKNSVSNNLFTQINAENSQGVHANDCILFWLLIGKFCFYFLLLAINIELEGCTIITNVNCDGSPHYQWQIHGAMTARKTTKHRYVILSEEVVKHRFHILIGKLRSAVSHLANDNPFTSVKYTIQLEDTHLPVNIVHRLLHLFNKENEVFSLRCVSL